MPRGKKESNRPSAGGIVRNDYHRRNRKEHKSMHKHSFGYIKGQSEPSSIPRWNLDALIRESVAWASRAYRKEPSTLDVKRVCVNYLRHCLTDYSELLRARQRGDRKSNYYAVSILVFGEISATYPWLSDECERQLKEREQVAARTKLVKKDDYLAQKIAEFNERHAPSPPVHDDLPEIIEDDVAGVVGQGALSSLMSPRLLYLPPFLKRDEINQRRFGGQLTMNDRWWEWEQEKELRIPEREQRFRWATT